jgi:hypothetical protein
MLVLRVRTVEAREEKGRRNEFPITCLPTFKPTRVAYTLLQTAGALTGRLLFVSKPGLAIWKKAHSQHAFMKSLKKQS